MTFLAALLALLIEQLRPLPSDNAVHRSIARAMHGVRRQWDAGQERHAVLVWAVSVLLPAVAAALVYMLLAHLSVLLALAWNVAVLYLCLGFRQFSHHFTAIRQALDERDDARAWAELVQWRGHSGPAPLKEELLRLVMVQGLLSAHRHVFGVFFCFVAFSALGLGPAGAVLYRLAEFIRRDRPVTDEAADPGPGHLIGWCRAAFRRLDYLPARLTAACFAMAGNFEEAVNRWRRDREGWGDPNDDLILSAAAGAAGLALTDRDVAEARVTMPATPLQTTPPPSGVSSAPGAHTAPLQALVGLVWRSLVLAMLLVALLSLANLLG